MAALSLALRAGIPGGIDDSRKDPKNRRIAAFVLAKRSRRVIIRRRVASGSFLSKTAARKGREQRTG
jgi:hypothetical protein